MPVTIEALTAIQNPDNTVDFISDQNSTLTKVITVTANDLTGYTAALTIKNNFTDPSPILTSSCSIAYLSPDSTITISIDSISAAVLLPCKQPVSVTGGVIDFSTVDKGGTYHYSIKITQTGSSPLVVIPVVSGKWYVNPEC